MNDSRDRNNSRRWGVRIVVVLIAAVAVPLGVSLLYHYPPTTRRTILSG